MANTMPPLAVPSSLVSTMPVMSALSANCLAWMSPFWPVVASTTISVSMSASGSSREMMRRILASSFIRLDLLCSRPAVSMMSISVPRALAAAMPSNTTEAGSEPSPCLTMPQCERSAQTVSCSAAAARKVSAAASRTFLPSAVYLAASLPMVVVLPTPFTPTIRMTEGFVSSFSSKLPTRRASARISTSAARTSSCPRSDSSRTFSRSCATALDAAAAPASASISESSSSS